MDITELILDDHHEQRRRFALLEQADGAGTEVLGLLWARLSTFLEVHAEAEEEIFYPELLRAGLVADRGSSATAETLDAISDHNEIRDAIAGVAGHQVGSAGWHSAIAAANAANGDHMAEEEREGLTDFRRVASLQVRHDLGVAFATFEARYFAGVRPVDKDPAGYVRWAQEAAGTRLPSGALGIGGLKGR